MSSVWIRLSNGREELIVHPDHIKRLLDDGGVVIPDPRIPVSEQVEIDSVEATEAVEPAQESDNTASDTPVRKRGRQSKSQDV